MRCLISLFPTLFERALCAKPCAHPGHTQTDAERGLPPFGLVTENLRILVSAQSDKATGFVGCVTDRLGQPRSPDLLPDDNDVFLDRARRAAGNQSSHSTYAQLTPFGVATALPGSGRSFRMWAMLTAVSIAADFTPPQRRPVCR